MSETDNAGRELNPTSIEFAATQLLKEPESSEPPKEEPEVAETEEQETAPPSPEDVEEVEEEPEELVAEAEDTDDEEEELETVDYFQVKVDGEELEVTLDELKSGYQRQSDYTRKTQTLAEQRKEYSSKAEELAKLQEDFMHQATLANELLNRDLKKFELVDWEKLKVEDPNGYVMKQLEVQDVKNQQEQLLQQVQQAQISQQQMQQEELAKYLETQKEEAVKVFPEWKDTEKAQEGMRAILDYGTKSGFSEQELNSIIHVRDLQIIDKARRWDEMQATKESIPKKKAAPVRKKVVKSKGTAPRKANRTKQVKAKQEQFRKSGSLRDAAAYMHELRESKVINKRK